MLSSPFKMKSPLFVDAILYALRRIERHLVAVVQLHLKSCNRVWQSATGRIGIS